MPKLSTRWVQVALLEVGSRSALQYQQQRHLNTVVAQFRSKGNVDAHLVSNCQLGRDGAMGRPRIEDDTMTIVGGSRGCAAAAAAGSDNDDDDNDGHEQEESLILRGDVSTWHRNP